MDTSFTERNFWFIVFGVAIAFIIFVLVTTNDTTRTRLVVDSTVEVCTRPQNTAPKEWCDQTILLETYERNKRNGNQ